MADQDEEADRIPDDRMDPTGAKKTEKRREERLAAASVVADGTAMDWVGPGLVGLSMLSPCEKWVQFGVAQSQLLR